MCFCAIVWVFCLSVLSNQQTVLAQIDNLNNRVAVEDPLQLEEAAVKKAMAYIGPMVVQIETIGGDATDGGTSTGTVVSTEGLVLTAAYNLRHQPTSIFVKAVVAGQQTPTRLVAEIVGTDRSRNLCLLKTKLDDSQSLTPVIAASENSMQVGRTTIAIGKVHDASTPSISVGILSATGRIWSRAIQTDAKISKANYGGPLINLRGQTIGVLVPLSPDDASVEAGSEWYDSGIGFAVPLYNYDQSIETLAGGVDLHQGLLGVSLKGNDLYADLPEIEYCSPKSPASDSGLLPGDRIMAIQGQPVASESQVKHVLGPKYAGDNISITVDRDRNAVTADVILAEKIEPFEELAIGIIPGRANDGDQEVAKVGVVLPQSPADDAGLAVGDIISAVGTEAVESWSDFQSIINRQSPESIITVVVRNETEANRSPSTTKEIILKPLTATLPPLKDVNSGVQQKIDDENLKKDLDIADGKDVEEVAISVAGFANRCTAYLPATAARRSGHGHAVLVWVAIPGTDDLAEIKSAVTKTVRQTGLVVLVPQSMDANQWSPEESEFIVKAIGRLKRKITIDPNRITIGGKSTAAMMGCLTAFLHRDTFRGLIMWDSLFPARTPLIETRPDQRLMVLLATSASFGAVEKLQKMKTVIEKRKFPVHHHTVKTKSFAEIMPLMGAWVDAVDRH